MIDLLEKTGYLVKKCEMGPGTSRRPPKEQLVMLLEKHRSIKKVAEILDVTTQSVRNYKRHYGIETKHFNTKRDDQRMIEMYNNGAMLGQIAKAMDCSTSTVYRWLEECGVELQGHRSRVEPSEVFELWRQGGWTQFAIAQELGCSQSHVSNVLNGRV